MAATHLGPTSMSASPPGLAVTFRSYLGGIVWWMPRGNPSPKLAITVDPDVHARVVAAAAAEGMSVSAWMTAAARRALLVRDGLAAVAEWEAEHGALTREELDAARGRIGAQGAERKSSRPNPLVGRLRDALPPFQHAQP